MKKIEILKRMIREEVRKIKLSEVTKYVVTWSDRDYKPYKKVFVDDPQGPAENGRLKAKKFMKSLEKKDAQSPYGLYRNIDLEWLSETKLKESIKTSWHDSKSRTIQVGDQLIYSKGKPKKIQVVKELDNGGLQYRFVERFRLGDDLFTIPPAYKKTHSGFLTIASNESELKESSFNTEVEDEAINLLDYLGGEVEDLPNWRANREAMIYFRDNGITNGNLAAKIYQRAVELSLDRTPKQANKRYLDN